MSVKLPGKDTSLWLDTTPQTSFEGLSSKSIKVDVAIAGGGIAGLLTAWMLAKEGLTTIVVEKARIVENTTGNTTAKLTSQHNLIYDFLIKEHGKDVAKAYGTANQQAIDDIEGIGKELQIDCDFERRDAYVYTEKKENLVKIHDEVDAASKLGLPASFEQKCDLPYPIEGAVKFSNQAQFHPRKFLLAIAKDYINMGGKIFEYTEVKDIMPGINPTLITDQGNIRAKYIIGATKYPFWRTELFENHTWTKLSYALGVELESRKTYPKGMYISTENPVRTLRSHPYSSSSILIFGGESHELTKDYDKNEHYNKLIKDVNNRFPVKKIVYRWIAGDVMPNDRIPYIGTYPSEKNIFIITGFHAWGLCWGMIAAQMVADEISGRTNPYRRLFSLNRLT